MNTNIIHHQPRPVEFALLRRLEIESECPDCPPGEPQTTITCPDCQATMVYRGIGRLQSGTRVHCFECVHSHREVHSVSLIIAQ